MVLDKIFLSTGVQLIDLLYTFLYFHQCGEQLFTHDHSVTVLTFIPLSFDDVWCCHKPLFLPNGSCSCSLSHCKVSLRAEFLDTINSSLQPWSLFCPLPASFKVLHEKSQSYGLSDGFLSPPLLGRGSKSMQRSSRKIILINNCDPYRHNESEQGNFQK